MGIKEFDISGTKTFVFLSLWWWWWWWWWGGWGGGVCMYSQCLAQFSDFLLEALPSGNAFYISFSSGVLYQSHLLRQTSNMLIKDHRGDGIQWAMQALLHLHEWSEWLQTHQEENCCCQGLSWQDQNLQQAKNHAASIRKLSTSSPGRFSLAPPPKPGKSALGRRLAGEVHKKYSRKGKLNEKKFFHAS